MSFISFVVGLLALGFVGVALVGFLALAISAFCDLARIARAPVTSCRAISKSDRTTSACARAPLAERASRPVLTVGGGTAMP